MNLISICGEKVFVFAFVLLGCLAAQSKADSSVAHFTIDATADVHPISRFIYGINQPITPNWSGATLTRLGGNRWTAYNWTSNASNAGNDYHYQNDGFLKGGDDPAGAMIPGIVNARDHDGGIILTVPTAGYVSADKKADGDVRNSNADYLKTRFHPEIAAKNAPFTLTPDPNNPVVFEDEMVNFIRTKFPWGFEKSDTPI